MNPEHPSSGIPRFVQCFCLGREFRNECTGEGIGELHAKDRQSRARLTEGRMGMLRFLNLSCQFPRSMNQRETASLRLRSPLPAASGALRFACKRCRNVVCGCGRLWALCMCAANADLPAKACPNFVQSSTSHRVFKHSPQR